MSQTKQIIHSTALLDGDIKLGTDVVIHPHAVLAGDITIDDGSVIGAGVHIFGKVRMGKDCRIQSHCFIPGGTIIEDDVFMGPGVMILNDKFPPSKGKHWRPVIIRLGVSIGGGSVISPGVEIAHNVLVGAASHVLKSVLVPNVIVFGNPVTHMSERLSSDKAAEVEIEKKKEKVP